MAKRLITIVVFLIVLGLCWPLLEKLNFGRLPGDIVFKSENVKFYFPLTTCVVISVVMSTDLARRSITAPPFEISFAS